MNDISDILRGLLDSYGNTSKLETEFLLLLRSDDELNAEYKLWCDSHGYSKKTGFREYLDEIIESRDSIWDNYKEFGNEI